MSSPMPPSIHGVEFEEKEDTSGSEEIKKSQSREKEKPEDSKSKIVENPESAEKQIPRHGPAE